LSEEEHTGLARNFDWGRRPNWNKNCDVILVMLFGDVMVMTSLKLCHNYFLKFNFVIISLKKQNLAKLRKFRSPKLIV